MRHVWVIDDIGDLLSRNLPVTRFVASMTD
jgi:hypothetical protein